MLRMRRSTISVFHGFFRAREATRSQGCQSRLKNHVMRDN